MEGLINLMRIPCERHKKVIFLSIIVSCAITIAVDIVFSYFKDIDLDSAIILKEMECISEGYVPYHTMHLNYPPLYFYWMAGLKWLLGIPYGCYYFYLTIQHLLLLCIGAFIYKISCAFGGTKSVSVITSCICLMLILRCGDNVIFEVPSMFWGLLASALIIRCPQGRFILLLAGLMTSFSFLTKQFGAGFIVLNAFVLLYPAEKQWGLRIFCYGVGVLIPIIVTFALFGKEFFTSTLFNGYGTTTSALRGEDISVFGKMLAVVHGLSKLFLKCPIAIFVLFIPLVSKSKRWRDFLFCLFGMLGFSLQFYFAPSNNHYFQYMVPFGALLIPIFVSLRVRQYIMFVFVLCFLGTIYSCVNKSIIIPLRHKEIVNVQKSRQTLIAQRIKEELPANKTLWIANTGLQCFYYLTNAATPNMAEIGYSAGPIEITIEKATKQVESADYILCWYDIDDDFSYDYFFTEDLREFTYQHPFVDLGDNIRLYTMNSN